MGSINKALPSKQQIMNAVTERHQRTLNGFSKRISELERAGGESPSMSHDKYSVAYSGETLAEINLLKEQMQYLTREWEELQRIESYYDALHDHVELGSAVVTPDKIFFVSCGVEEFEVDGARVCGVSVCTPLYQAMRSKQIGESFDYEGKTYSICDIF